MPAGVPWGPYLRYTTAALLSMLAGAQMVHYYYNPLKDLDKYVEEVSEKHKEYDKAIAEKRKESSEK